MDGKAEIVGWKRLLEVFFVLFISGGVLWLNLLSTPAFPLPIIFSSFPALSRFTYP